MEGDMVNEKKKKRKRLDVKIQSLSETNDKIPPIVGYFPSGFDPQNSRKSDADDEENPNPNPKVRVFRHKNKNFLQVLVSPNQSKVEFVGTSYSGEAALPQLCSYALGILDKDKQSLKIVPIAANKIFRLEPRVREPPKELNEEDPIAEKQANKMRDLTNLYGTKKDIRKARKWDSLRLKEGDLEAQKDLIEDIRINVEAAADATVYGARNIPPHDETATTPDKAYLLDKIILKVEHDHLSDVLELMQVAEDAALSTEFWQQNAYPTFVSNRIHKLGEVQDDDGKKKLACIFSYMTHLIMFMNLPSHSQKSMQRFHNNSGKYHNIPITIFQKFVKLFVNSEADKLSNEKLDLLISYILVLTLFVDGFETEISDIAKDLKMKPMQLRLHYQNLGCKLSNVKKSIIVTLPVPLEFPELRTKRIKRR
ncbi:DNA-directed RNA polymerase I subunit rpa49-like [Tasmannia lanceolata]|uniref:DNA-directed RNA polymerase I subunit rpa49-like n=1 Tax=Tasmannia lanceolata TaxID=3420 RepID=UPI004063ABD3